MTDTLSVAELCARIPNGAVVALPADYSGCAMTAVRELIARGVRDLHIVCMPQGGFQVDWLVGAGAVARIEAAAVTLGEHGIAPRFDAAIKAGEIEMWDSTCPALLAALQAGEKGQAFTSLRGIIGSDLLRVRPDWRVINNPLADSGVKDPVVILPPIKPDIALFHALKADRNGNVWIGVQRELMTAAHAAREAFVTVERIEDTDFLRDPALAPGTISSLYISAIAIAKDGAWPVGLDNAYAADNKALADYTSSAATAEGFAKWMADPAKVAAHA